MTDDAVGLEALTAFERRFAVPDGVDLLREAIVVADMVNTVSPSYAREILTPEGGAGLDALLRHRSYDVHGILNGLDYDSWDPAEDSRLPHHFSIEKLDEA